jgi:hypothetical protein
MIREEPTAELDSQFSSDDATPIPWTEGRERLEGAEVYWISTVRPDGRAHVTPLLSVWLDGALYFCTGPDDPDLKSLDRLVGVWEMPGEVQGWSPSSRWRVASSSSSASTSGSTDRGLKASRPSGTNGCYRAHGNARLAGGRQRQRRYRGLERSRARVRLLVLLASTLYTAVVRIVGALCFGRDLATAVGE